MARSKARANECCGLVGGEVTNPGVDDGYAPDYGSMVHVADRLASGSEHEYLGHFRQQQYARKGHNDITEPGLPTLKVPTSTLTPQAQAPLPQPKVGGGQGGGLLGSLLGDL